MNKAFLTATLLVIWYVPTRAQEVPKAKISNGTISAEIYLPDAVNGYYRGARFDWSGVVSQLNYKGHSYFGQWFEKYDPFLHDAITGPVEAFDPLGYDQAKVGQTFVKVGVGVLERLDTAPYHFSKPYKIVDHGIWSIKHSADKVEFVHDLVSEEYSYSYKKVVRLSGNKMIIDHTLTNKGGQVIDTQVFDHNFFVIDNATVGPGFLIRFPFGVEGDASGLGDFAEVSSGEVRYTGVLGKNDHARLRSIGGYGGSAADYDIAIENRNTGAGVRITCDRPLSRLIFWSALKTVCPEPYIGVKVAPSESFSWTITYDYYTL
ncbi:MAG: hypothetical protein ACMVP2_22255 [Imperialibacter sp.]|uniref:hypothetical protein n=1 Tax=Imperialibacter sp. TaxID=2038411 RepID=UPI003A87929F